MNTFETPVLFLVFNRPQHTRRVFERIRAIKPKFLFVAADGPRTSVPEDVEKCREVRETVLDGIDWECRVKTLFRNENLGCGRAPSEAITWFFKNVEEGIILEDDCLPEIFFFHFCSTLLARFRNENRVMHISGNNFQNGINLGKETYYFSAYNHNWGWATWRRCWSEFNYTLSAFDPIELASNLRNYGFNKSERKFWIQTFKQIKDKPPHDIWDYQWIHAIWKNSGISILPNENLVVNIGFDSEATHTKEPPFQWARKLKIDSNWVHPDQFIIDSKADHSTFETLFNRRGSFFREVKNKLLLNSLIRAAYNIAMSNKAKQ